MQLRLLFFVLFVICPVFAQDSENTGYLDVNYLRGNVLNHAPDINHLITGHPDGIIFSYNFKTDGKKEWHQVYNYPDYGFSFMYQDFENEILGKSYAVSAHYNFYFLNRNLMLRISQGIGMTTNPYDKETNFKNNALGSKFMSSNYFLLQFQKQHLIGPIGLQAGLFLTHFSNGRIKTPNRGINTYGINVGLNYNLDEPLVYKTVDSIPKLTEPLRYNIFFKTGINENSVVGSGQKPFYHLGGYVDKRIGRKSALQLGTELFITQSLKEYIRYRSVAFPEKEYISPNTDYKRVGVFAGHELFINRLSIETQFGFYVYKPFKEDLDVYQRLGIKYYVTPKVFTGASLKSHGAKAEAIEFGVGLRL
ncbi:MAG: acyloxyacyl hydrolase [Flavobacteriaceae bacterium]|jgi:hypothetical protein|nr:acyloxyacyl hydrolase [Flavobacteriaceae bacterium]